MASAGIGEWVVSSFNSEEFRMIDVSQVGSRWWGEMESHPRSHDFMCGVKWASGKATLDEVHKLLQLSSAESTPIPLSLTIVLGMINETVPTPSNQANIAAFWARTGLPLVSEQASGEPTNLRYGKQLILKTPNPQRSPSSCSTPTKICADSMLFRSIRKWRLIRDSIIRTSFGSLIMG